MFIVFLKFSQNKENAKEFMAAHKAWIKQGVDEEAFLVVGSLEPNQGGCIITHNLDRAVLETRLKQDPFVTENVVSAEIHEVTPAICNKSFNFLTSEG